ncbi:MAG: hypothetical protein KDH96_08555 [Candidatus Riesia sp.]|nr:hypothetical protein [Candidatus Riesia sp.]
MDAEVEYKVVPLISDAELMEEFFSFDDSVEGIDVEKAEEDLLPPVSKNEKILTCLDSIDPVHKAVLLDLTSLVDWKIGKKPLTEVSGLVSMTDIDSLIENTSPDDGICDTKLVMGKAKAVREVLDLNKKSAKQAVSPKAKQASNSKKATQTSVKAKKEANKMSDDLVLTKPREVRNTEMLESLVKSFSTTEASLASLSDEVKAAKEASLSVSKLEKKLASLEKGMKSLADKLELLDELKEAVSALSSVGVSSSTVVVTPAPSEAVEEEVEEAEVEVEEEEEAPPEPPASKAKAPVKAAPVLEAEVPDGKELDVAIVSNMDEWVGSLKKKFSASYFAETCHKHLNSFDDTGFMENVSVQDLLNYLHSKGYVDSDGNVGKA